MLFYTISQFFFYDIENNHDALASYLKIILGVVGKHGERGGGGSTAKLSRTVAFLGAFEGALGGTFGGLEGPGEVLGGSFSGIFILSNAVK